MCIALDTLRLVYFGHCLEAKLILSVESTDLNNVKNFKRKPGKQTLNDSVKAVRPFSPFTLLPHSLAGLCRVDVLNQMISDISTINKTPGSVH